jgi:glycosyltransferase involved in cell wall biosynthesis
MKSNSGSSPSISYRPLVSVIIIFLNAEGFIQEAIDSVFSQTYQEWQLVLVDDGSTDTSSNLARRLAEEYPGRVCYVEHEGHQNRGMSASRNLGIRAVRSDYIAFLDADDVWLPNKLEQQVAILEKHTESALVYGLDQYWHSWTGNPADQQRDFTYKPVVPPNTVIEPPMLIPLFLRGQFIVPSPSGILVRRSAALSVNGFEEAFRGMYEDQAFYAKLFLSNNVFASDEHWIRYRQHPNSSCAIAQRTGQDRTAREFFLYWLKEYLQGQKVRDPRIWSALQVELWKHHYPRMSWYLKRLRQSIGWVVVSFFGKK